MKKVESIKHIRPSTHKDGLCFEYKMDGKVIRVEGKGADDKLYVVMLALMGDTKSLNQIEQGLRARAKTRK